MPKDTQTFLCEQCGAILAPGFLEGCFKCLLLEGLDKNTSNPGENPPIGEERFYQHYEILVREDGSLWELGRGAMGITYKAQDVNLHVPVALKVINSLYSFQPAVRSRFLREARAAAQLVHPNVASVFHFGTITTPSGAKGIAVNEDDCFYAMEFIEGETLEARVQREETLPPRFVIEIGIQVARALVAAEKKGLMHCDLKPSNIMLPLNIEEASRHGEAWVKVIDFGVAKAVTEAVEITEHPNLESCGEIGRTGFLGTPSFASPEQLAGEKLDVRSDIFSLGVTLWQSLTGELPFPGNTLGAIRSLQEAESLPQEALIKVNCPPSLQRVLSQMLSFDKARRPFSALALLEMLSNCLRFFDAPKPKDTNRIITHDREAFQFYRSAQDALHSSYPTKDHYDAAIHLLESAVGRDPDFALAYSMLAETHAMVYRHGYDRSSERASSALASVEAAQRLNPKSGETYRARGNYDYHIQSDYQGARHAFIEALRILPNDADSLLGLGLVELRLNRWEAALECFEKAAALNPYKPEYLNQWWSTLEAMRRYPEARRVLDYMIKRHPENLRLRLNRTYLAYCEVGNWLPLKESLDAVPPGYDPDGIITFLRWSIARWKNDPDTAERLLAVSPLPEFVGHCGTQFYPRETLELLTVMLRGDMEKSSRIAAGKLPSLQEQMEKNPQSPKTLMALAIHEAISLNFSVAITMGNRAIEMLPPDADGVDGPKLTMQMAWIYILAQEFDRAMAVLEEAISWPGCVSYGDLLWDVNYRPLRKFPRFQKMLESLAPNTD